MANITTQIKLQNSNSAGKKFVGIAALNNISHAISNFVGIKIKPLNNTYRINGVETSFFNEEEGWDADTVYSKIDHSRVSRTLGMFVGAAADNAKEAVLGALNITPTTANIAMTLLRMGFPLNIVAGIMNIPAIKNISVNKTSFEFQKALSELEVDEVNTLDVNITFEDLLQMSKGTENRSVEAAVLTLLKEILPISNGYSRLNNITSLNSTKNAVGPTPYEVNKKKIQINKFEEEYKKSEMEEGVFTESLTQIYDKAPFLLPLKNCYTELVPNICKEWSPIFNDTFESIINTIRDSFGISIDNYTDKLFKTIINSFLVYNASKHLNINNNIFKDFIESTLKIKEEHPNTTRILDLLQILDIKGTKNDKEVILRISTLNRSDIENISAEWEDMVTSENEDLAKYFKDLLMYFTITKGFYWHPLSGKTIASYNTRVSLENYDKIFTDFTAFENGGDTRFLVQLLGNLTSYKKLWKEYEGNYTKSEKNNEIILTTVSSEKLIKIEDKYYLRYEDGNCTNIPILGISGKFYEFDANKDLEKSIIEQVNNDEIEDGETDPEVENTEEFEQSSEELLTQKINGYVKVLKKQFKKESSNTIWNNYIENKKDNIKQALISFYDAQNIQYKEEEIDTIINNIKEENNKYCM